jgi:flagellar biosynthesis activator protein FlaF
MYTTAQQAYEAVGKATDSNRTLEAAALFKIARQMELHRDAGRDPGRAELLNGALMSNLRLWTLFQSEVAQPDNELPTDLRVDLLKLSAFVDRRTFEVMVEPSPEKIQSLIDINRHVASGLAATPEN